MAEFIRFLFSGNDIQKIDRTVMQVEDVPPATGVPIGSPAPGSMKLRFRQNDPGPAQIRPLFPGAMQFLADPAAPGVLPDANSVAFTTAAYSGWKTLGRLLITATDKAVTSQLSALAPGLPVKPNMVWYSPVRIPQGFLFDTLRNGLKKGTIPAAAGRTIKPSNQAEWEKFAVAEFLAGRYAPVLQVGADATQNDIIRFVMPTVEVPASGDIELYITTALSQNPLDGPNIDFEDPLNLISNSEPLHPRNGLIPAREVYRQLRPNMVSEAPAEPLRDSVLAGWPSAPRFFPVSFTRTWELLPDCSTHFTRHTVHIEAGGNTLMDQQLPAHGVVFVPQSPANPPPAPPVIDVSLVGGDMKWLAGGGTSWRDKGTTNPVRFDLAAVAQPHISVRLPMSKAIFSDMTRTNISQPSCTYLSMRRSLVRALVDNRIAGGRLNYGVNVTSATTRGIIQRAFAGTGASVNLIADNKPDPLGDPGLAASLIPILNAFFPDDAPQQPMPGAPVTIYKQGEMAYDLWQSRYDIFEGNSTKRNFSDSYIGRGGPGAAVALGLATFVVDPVRNAGEADDAYFDRVVGEMLVGLEPGALLQFWNLDSDFVHLKTRSVGAGGTASYGHSPIFIRYVTDSTNNTVTGIRILDQHGEANEIVTGVPGKRIIPWLGYKQQIWIAANWNE